MLHWLRWAFCLHLSEHPPHSRLCRWGRLGPPAILLLATGTRGYIPVVRTSWISPRMASTIFPSARRELSSLMKAVSPLPTSAWKATPTRTCSFWTLRWIELGLDKRFHCFCFMSGIQQTGFFWSHEAMGEE